MIFNDFIISAVANPYSGMTLDFFSKPFNDYRSGVSHYYPKEG